MAASKKLSTLVIDAVVDTKGIDKAVGSINSKLRGVGGAAGGGAAAGQFRAGMTPYGLQFGSDAAATAAAAAIGAAAGGGGGSFRNRMMGRGLSNQVMAQHGFSTMGRSRNRYSLTNQMLSSFSSVHSAELFDMMDPLRGGDPDDVNVFTDAQSRINRHVNRRRQIAQRLQRIKRTKLSNIFTNTEYSMFDLNAITSRGFGSTAKMIGAGLGIGGGAMAIQSLMNFRQRMGGLFSDKKQFQGTPYADIASQFRADYRNNRGMSPSQAFMIGARNMQGGKMTNLEKTGMNTQDYYRNVSMGAGAALEGISSGQFFDYYAQAIYPGSPLRQLAGEDPNNLGGFARLQKSTLDGAVRLMNAIF